MPGLSCGGGKGGIEVSLVCVVYHMMRYREVEVKYVVPGLSYG